ncbi:MAG: hypothetical protein ABMB14_30305, partial [Myxococcota bacterium]
MPGHLSRVLDTIDRWPTLAGLAYGWATAPPSPPHAWYLASIAGWQLVGLDVAAEDRVRLGATWKTRPDLRELLADAIGYTVCVDFVRMVHRQVLDGGRADLARWIAVYPELIRPWASYFEARTRRYNHPLDVVDACAVSTRYLGADPGLWRATAAALHRDPRRDRDPGEDPRRFLRPDTDTGGWLTDDELGWIDRASAALGATPIDPVPLDAWWHPQPRSLGALLARAAAASRAVAGDDWGPADVERYARA